MFFRGRTSSADRPSIEVSRHSGVREYFCRLRQDLFVGIAARDVRKDESPHAGGRGKLGRFRRGEMAVVEGHSSITFEKGCFDHHEVRVTDVLAAELVTLAAKPDGLDAVVAALAALLGVSHAAWNVSAME